MRTTPLERFANRLFTITSIVVHTCVFVLWAVTHGLGLDNAGFTIGTAALSLEAIYITLLVGVAVARQSTRLQEHNHEMMEAHTRMLVQAEEDNERIIQLLED